MKNQRIFLRRTKFDELHPEDLFVGNRVNIFSRQLNLTGYGDQYTANKLGSKKERYFNHEQCTTAETELVFPNLYDCLLQNTEMILWRKPIWFLFYCQKKWDLSHEILFYVSQKKESHTGLDHHEVEDLMTESLYPFKKKFTHTINC